jgi:hypothetical protein
MHRLHGFRVSAMQNLFCTKRVDDAKTPLQQFLFFFSSASEGVLRYPVLKGLPSVGSGISLPAWFWLPSMRLHTTHTHTQRTHTHTHTHAHTYKCKRTQTLSYAHSGRGACARPQVLTLLELLRESRHACYTP